jgi:predicted ATPase
MGAILCPVVSRTPAGAVRFANTHLSDDETVAKMGHPGLESDMREAAKKSNSKKPPNSAIQSKNSVPRSSCSVRLSDVSFESTEVSRMKLKSVRVQRFKRVIDASFDVPELAVLIGGNNAGKSTIIQALHFGIAVLQTIETSGTKWGKGRTLSTSLNPTDILYSPSENVYALGPGRQLSSKKDLATRIDYTLESGQTCSISFFKGKNRNIAVIVSNPVIAKELCKLDEPFSIYSPGLAGISKQEAYVSDGVLFRALSRGDANLVLRNILLRLWPGDSEDQEKQDKWEEFVEHIRQIFPSMELSVEFNTEVDEFISVSVTTDGQHWVPLEIVGTGVLQAMQILSYIHRFTPKLVVLDEPDSHLHPNNQRLLCALLRQIANYGSTQVLLTTHSRHVLDAVGGTGNILWVRQGGIEVANQDDQVGVLLDIGALDIRERVGDPSTTAIILTEDEVTTALGLIVEASGFDPAHTVTQSYFGVTEPHNLRPLIHMIRKIHPKAVVVVHRDRDFMTPAEVDAWETEMRALKVFPFVTEKLDIESHLLNSLHLTELNATRSSDEFEGMIDSILAEQQEELVKNFVNGRVELARRDKTFGGLDLGDLAIKAQKQVALDPRQFAGKTTLRKLRRQFKTATGRNLITHRKTTAISTEALRQAAKKVSKVSSKVAS